MYYLYVITNEQDGKVYIGVSCRKDRNRRWVEHKNKLQRNKHSNPHLQSAWTKYGPDSFSYHIKCEVDTLEESVDAEIELISKARETVGCYNCRDGGEYGGKITSKEILLNIKKANQKIWSSKKRRQKMSETKKEQYKNPKLKELVSDRTREAMNRPEVKIKFVKKYDGFIDPTGNVYSPVIDLKAFSVTHGLHRGNMVLVDQGKRKSHKGWTKYVMA